MPDTLVQGEAVLEVISPDGARKYVRVSQTPFLIGRGAETGNHLQLTDRRISRNCAAIVTEANRYYVEDRGARRGIYLNSEKIETRPLNDGDVISFGVEDSYQVIFRAATGTSDESIPQLLTRIDHMTSSESTGGGLKKLNLLLEATSLLHSQLPLDSVLAKMIDHAVAVTDADRGLLEEAVESHGGDKLVERLRVRLARRSGGQRLPPETMTASQTAIQLAINKQLPVITEDIEQAEMNLQAAASIVAQGLRAVVVIPLYATTRASSESATNVTRGEFLGVLYLDSKRPTAFSKLDRQILDALAADAASILDNARLVEKERERQRLEQEIGIARDIQQALLPKNLTDFPHLAVSGVNFPCLAVGGDYFDVFPLDEHRTAFLLADVSGKGLGAALVTTMLQGALSGMTLGTDPARVLNHVNRFLCDHVEVGRYATMFFGILDDTGKMEYINAGHPSPILMRGGSAVEAFTEGSFPVGLVPEAEFSAATLQLEPNDTLLLFSDGVTEAMDPAEELYGVARLRTMLQGKHEAPLDEIQKMVLESVENFARGARQADDLTVLLVRYRAVGALVAGTNAPGTKTDVANA
jgi:sigma-B regulation protein RsbU (phosphoserine phosphatase)